MHDALHSTLVYPEWLSSSPQQTWPVGQSDPSSHAIDVPPMHPTGPAAAQPRLGPAPPLHVPQQISDPAAHVFFRPSLFVPQ
jgi:hypothetical protein